MRPVPPFRPWLLLFALAVVLTVATVADQRHDVRRPTPGAPRPGPTRCVEDMSCWDCSTMGNHICGPTPGHPNRKDKIMTEWTERMDATRMMSESRWLAPATLTAGLVAHAVSVRSS